MPVDLGDTLRWLRDEATDADRAILEANPRVHEIKYRDGLEQIVALLGHKPGPNHPACKGCAFEMQEVRQIAQNLLDGKEYDDHWGPWRPATVRQRKPRHASRTEQPASRH